MKICKYILSLMAGLLLTTEICAATFIEGLEDVPVMEGLTQIKNDNVSFGNEEGRFVEVYLEGKKARFKEVRKFYRETLPQLGWTYQGEKKENTLVFLRDGESLELAEDDNAPLKVRITVKSKN